MAERNALDELNRIVADMMPREPSYRYWQYENRRFCWTTERIEFNGRKRFVAFIRKELVSRRKRNSRTWTLVKKVGFARRKVAKARAQAWHENWRRMKEESNVHKNEERIRPND